MSHLRDKLNVEIGTQAWAKMYEILVEFQLITSIDREQLISLHLCEAPGAFISALNHYLTTQSNGLFSFDRRFEREKDAMINIF